MPKNTMYKYNVAYRESMRVAKTVTSRVVRGNGDIQSAATSLTISPRPSIFLLLLPTAARLHTCISGLSTVTEMESNDCTTYYNGVRRPQI